METGSENEPEDRSFCPMYDNPVSLRKDEFEKLRDFEPSKTLVETKETFLIHCALG